MYYIVMGIVSLSKGAATTIKDIYGITGSCLMIIMYCFVANQAAAISSVITVISCLIAASRIIAGPQHLENFLNL